MDEQDEKIAVVENNFYIVISTLLSIQMSWAENSRQWAVLFHVISCLKRTLVVALCTSNESLSQRVTHV